MGNEIDGTGESCTDRMQATDKRTRDAVGSIRVNLKVHARRCAFCAMLMFCSCVRSSYDPAEYKRVIDLHDKVEAERKKKKMQELDQAMMRKKQVGERGDDE